jgi:hypothetical protein
MDIMRGNINGRSDANFMALYRQDLLVVMAKVNRTGY